MADKIRVLLTEEEVNKKISEVAAQINKDYEGKEVHLICILKGGVFFTCELAKRLTVPVTLDFMSVSSYGSGTQSSGVVKIVKDLDQPLGAAGGQECHHRGGHYRFRTHPGISDRGIKTEKSEKYRAVHPA